MQREHPSRQTFSSHTSCTDSSALGPSYMHLVHVVRGPGFATLVSSYCNHSMRWQSTRDLQLIAKIRIPP